MSGCSGLITATFGAPKSLEKPFFKLLKVIGAGAGDGAGAGAGAEGVG